MGVLKMGVGKGKTKKEAEQSAAKSALEKLAKETT
jgi:dsRNA-specific ribonuclease